MSAASRLSLPAPWTAQLLALRARWLALGPRERLLLWLSFVMIGVLLLWTVAIQPAWRTLRDAPAQIESLEAQLQEMQALAAETRLLRAAPALSAEQSEAALKAATERLGAKARLSLQGGRAVLTLNGASSAQLREWLAEARAGARARPVEAQLSRNAQGFSGSLVLSIGSAP
ncbi:MAG: type II secretion system protein GspM [Rubrivivax sp.]